MVINPEQCRAARALLDWSRTDLAEASGVGQSTISKFERRERTPHRSNVAALQASLEAAGVVFIEGGEAIGSGVQFRDPGK